MEQSSEQIKGRRRGGVVALHEVRWHHKLKFSDEMVQKLGALSDN